MGKCPVCEASIAEPVPSYCERCGWDLANDITLVTSVHEIPEKVRSDYLARVKIAKTNWSKQIELERKLREQEASGRQRIDELERRVAEQVASQQQEEHQRQKESDRLQKEAGKQQSSQRQAGAAIRDTTGRGHPVHRRKTPRQEAKAWVYNARYPKDHTLFGDCGRRILLCTNAIRIDPTYVNAFEERGDAHSELKQYDEAISDYTRAIELLPDYAPPYRQRSLCYQAKGNKTAAAADSEKYEELKRREVQMM